MQHHLTKTCIEFTNKLNPQQVAAVDCSDQPIYALAKLSNRNTYSVQLSVVPIYICLKKAHKAGNSALLLYLWAKERSSTSRMFKYWMLIRKFQIDYLVFIPEYSLWHALSKNRVAEFFNLYCTTV